MVSVEESRLVTMIQLVVIVVVVLAGLGQTTPTNGGNDTAFLSMDISTAEGDTYSIDIAPERTDGKEIVHSTMNGNGTQTIVMDHVLNISVIIPASESDDCHFTELNDEEKTEHVLKEEDADDVDTDSEILPNTKNTTEEKACLYDEDEPDMTEEVKTAVEDMCGTRRIRHLTKKAACQDIPQDGSQQAEDSDETGSGELVRRKRWWGRCPYRCYWIRKRVKRCYYRRKCFLFFCYRKKYCVTTYYLSFRCGRYC
ncbi:uncharacterized protein [Argopecten irradians]|uniref:uncharacterized protein n=1 Tax=Argopecten irradians TaxID=31199 RepID=UPI00371D8B52